MLLSCCVVEVIVVCCLRYVVNCFGVWCLLCVALLCGVGLAGCLLCLRSLCAAAGCCVLCGVCCVLAVARWLLFAA